MPVSVSIQSLIRHLGWFQISTIRNTAAINIWVQIFLQHTDFISFGNISRSRVAGHVVILFLIFEDPSLYFPYWLYSFSFLCTVSKGSLFFILSPEFLSFQWWSLETKTRTKATKKPSHPSRCEVIFQSTFTLYLPND